MTTPGRDLALRTSRLLLEPLDPSHGAELWSAAARSLEELRPWLPWAIDAEEARIVEFATRCVSLWEQGSDHVFTLVHDGVAAGLVGLHNIDRVAGSASMGYWLDSRLTGRGLMTEAGEAVVELAFAELRLHRLGLLAAPGNVASVRVAEKLGFRREGQAPRYLHIDGGWRDHVIFGLTVEEVGDGVLAGYLARQG